MDHFAGFEADRGFNPDVARQNRVATIATIRVLIDKKIIPILTKLQNVGALESDVVVLTGAMSSLPQRLQQLLTTADTSPAAALRKLAFDLSAIPDAMFGYQRRERASTAELAFSADRFKADYFNSIMARIEPTRLTSEREPDFSALPTAGELQIEPFPQTR
jgi:hypothetical protein